MHQLSNHLGISHWYCLLFKKRAREFIHTATKAAEGAAGMSQTHLNILKWVFTSRITQLSMQIATNPECLQSCLQTVWQTHTFFLDAPVCWKIWKTHECLYLVPFSAPAFEGMRTWCSGWWSLRHDSVVIYHFTAFKGLRLSSLFCFFCRTYRQGTATVFMWEYCLAAVEWRKTAEYSSLNSGLYYLTWVYRSQSLCSSCIAQPLNCIV